MSEPLDISNLLQTGYFATSRARNAKTPSPKLRPSSFAEASSPPRRTSRIYETSSRPSRRSYPPPPSVEDEAVSLAKEYGSPHPSMVTEEQPHSRGDIEQDPIVIEVHEHNPERRFVILPESLKASAQSKEKAPRTSDQKAKRDSASPERSADRLETPRRDASPGTARPNLERRRSRQDLPRLETERRADMPYYEHHKSSSFAGGTRPDYFSPRTSRPPGEQLLSPDVIINSSSGRDRKYHGASRSPSQKSGFQPEREERRHRQSSAAPPANRLSLNVDSGPSKRAVSNDRTDHRQRDEYSSRTETRDSSRSYGRSESDRKAPTPEKSREHSRSSDPRSTRRTTVIHDSRTAMAGSGKEKPETQSSGPQPKVRTTPQPSPHPSPKPPSRFPDEINKLRSSATFPVMMQETQTPTQLRSASVLPYPDDDIYIQTKPGWEESARASRPEPIVSMPSMPPHILIKSVQASDDATRVPSPVAAAAGLSQSWQPAKFDPEKDGYLTDKTVGSYRRYSESNDKSNAGRLPDCHRTKPIAGKMDWLTLPRTDFNICPDCYGAVFANTDYRTQFQPILRPTDEAIACDFGSSPWYRIAWLLVSKSQKPDLRLFHHIVNVRMTARTQPCPGDKTASRAWLGVKDPHTRRLVSDFTICHHCANMVEVLLPNLSGIFVPVDSRREPTRSSCALHFSPERKQFVLYFDALEITSDKASATKKAPDLADLAKRLDRLIDDQEAPECCEDNPVSDGRWHTMQFLPEFTVCAECFDRVVRPRLDDDNMIARNFYMRPQRLSWGTCQLYSTRMREIFRKACRYQDAKYLEDRVKERRRIEGDIRSKLGKLDREGRNDAWTEQQVEQLIREWKRWE